IDTFALQQYDANFETPDPHDMIKIPGGNVTALAIDPAGKYLYAAGLGRVYVIDIDPGSPDYLKLVTDAEHVIEVEAFSRGRFGHITSLAVNADGTRLYAAVPVSEMFAQRSWVAGERDNGIIFVINTD